MYRAGPGLSFPKLFEINHQIDSTENQLSERT
jgi:hypothetical protein